MTYFWNGHKKICVLNLTLDNEWWIFWDDLEGVKIWAATWQNQQSESAPSKDSDQPGHPPSLIRVFAVRMKKAWILSYPLSALRILWSGPSLCAWRKLGSLATLLAYCEDLSDLADAQADLSLRWAHTHFVGFVMSWLIFSMHCLVLIVKICSKNFENRLTRIKKIMWNKYFLLGIF